MGSLVFYIVGMLLVVGGVAYGAWLAGVPDRWLMVAVIVMLGLGLMGAARRVRSRGPRA